MRRPVVSRSIILVNGSDAIGGVEGGTDLVRHPKWKVNLMYVSADDH